VSRLGLSLLLGGLVLATGLGVCFIQAENHARAQALAARHRECEMVEAAVEVLELQVRAHVPGLDQGARQ
jgi:hypothetical protein